ncbi:MAG: ABC transporter permease [Candidatus Dormibacteria bacterium]
MIAAVDRPRRLRLVVTPVVVLVGLILLVGYAAGSATPGDEGIINRTYLSSRLGSHLELVAIAYTLAVVIGVPVGVLLVSAGRLARVPVLLVANLGQATPSIGVLGLAYAVTGLGLRTATIALLLYGLLPILRNTLVAIEGVDEAALDAARGMGMTRLQQLRQVQLPLAAPAIFAGLRTSLVLIIGTATLADFVGAGGLGDVINAGIGAGRDRIIYVGAGMVAALALLADWALGLIERLLTPRT